ncbi:hypothetical protein TNCV_624531 [Trichonephila clavipes]|nr:hypothetical protein TNCV_624531 [Trichonephila clavipes]
MDLEVPPAKELGFSYTLVREVRWILEPWKLRRSNCTADLEPANSPRLGVELPTVNVCDFSLACTFKSLFYAREMRHFSERDSKFVDPFAN